MYIYVYIYIYIYILDDSPHNGNKYWKTLRNPEPCEAFSEIFRRVIAVDASEATVPRERELPLRSLAFLYEILS